MCISNGNLAFSNPAQLWHLGILFFGHQGMWILLNTLFLCGVFSTSQRIIVQILLEFLLKFRKKLRKNLLWKFMDEFSVKYLWIRKWTRWIRPMSVQYWANSNYWITQLLCNSICTIFNISLCLSMGSVCVRPRKVEERGKLLWCFIHKGSNHLPKI